MFLKLVGLGSQKIKSFCQACISKFDLQFQTIASCSSAGEVKCIGLQLFQIALTFFILLNFAWPCAKIFLLFA